jgi:hypothetical protein
MFSSFGTAAQAGATSSELLLQMNPFYSIPVAATEAWDGVQRGDTRPLAALSGGMLGGALVARGTPYLPGYKASNVSLTGAAAQQLQRWGVPDWNIRLATQQPGVLYSNPLPVTLEQVGHSSNGAYSRTASSAYQYQLLKRDLWHQEVANPGESMSGPVVFADPKGGATPAQIQQIRRQIDLFNLSIDEGYMSPTGRVSTAGTLQRESKAAAREERVMAEAQGRPYAGVVGHGPDTTWTGRPVAPFWQDMDFSINSSLGRQAQNYPIGYKPTRAIYKGDLN